MLFVKSLEVPANTPASQPVEEVLTVGARRLVNIDIFYPPGCLRTVGVRILEDGYQIVPRLSGWVAGDGEHVNVAENWRLSDAKRLVIQAYSIAEDWAHTVTISFNITM